jgi:competence protein ComEA
VVEAPVVEEPVEVVKENPVVVEVPAVVEKININTARAVELHEKTGISQTACYLITGYRTKNGPYKNLDDLKNVKQVSQHILDVLRDVVEFGPMPEQKKDETDYAPLAPGEKVNINKIDNITKLQKKTGMSQRTASEIIRHREQFGDYEKIDDLLNLKAFGKIAMNRYGHMLEV